MNTNMKPWQRVPKSLLREMRITPHQWRLRKREELRRIKQAVANYYFGCAYTPCSFQLGQIEKLLTEMETLQSRKNWGK